MIAGHCRRSSSASIIPSIQKPSRTVCLKISPELPGVSANIMGDTITIQGETKGRTTYTVTVDCRPSGYLRAETWEKHCPSQFKVGSADKMLIGPDQNFITLDPASGDPVFRSIPSISRNLDVQIYTVQPSDWPAFRNTCRITGARTNRLAIPGKKVFDKSIDVKSVADTLTRPRSSSKTT